MSNERFIVEKLGKEHRCHSGFEKFRSGSESLDTYLHTRASQDVKRSMANCFLVFTVDRSSVVGYYTLSTSSVSLADIPSELKKRLPYYPCVPAAILGRLAVHIDFQKTGVGGFMIADAITRIRKDSMAARFLLVDAADDAAAGFYEHYGFVCVDQKARTRWMLNLCAGRFGLSDTLNV